MKTRMYTMLINASDTLSVRVPLTATEFKRKREELLQQAREALHPDFPVEIDDTRYECNHVITFEQRFRVGMSDIVLEERVCEPGYHFLSAKNRR